jgi:D-3-phosphoglycerate dehydrogenase
MTQPIRILYVGPTSTGVFDPSSLEQQSRAVRLAGGTVTRYEGHSSAELAQAARDADAVMVQGHSQTAFAPWAYGRCKGLVSFGHGFDHLDLDAATINGVILANTASFGTEEVSNHTMMHFLVCSRKYVLHDKLVRSGVWTRKNLGPMGHIAGQVFGIVGVGDIGRAVARKAKAFGLEVIAYDPYVASWDALEYGVEMMDSLEELCRRSDYISVHIYLNAGRAISAAARGSRSCSPAPT